MSHGLDHTDADVVLEAPGGWYVRRLLDGRVHIVKYRISNPNASEKPEAELYLRPEQWHELVTAVGFGESAVVGEIRPAAPVLTPPPKLPPPDQLPEIVPSAEAAAVTS